MTEKKGFSQNKDFIVEGIFFFDLRKYVQFYSLGSNAGSRAYLNFVNQEDIIEFTETFDGYVFVDSKGTSTKIVITKC